MTIPSTLLATTQLVPLAKELDENKVTPGVLGFIVFAVLGGAVWMLMKSMNKQFTKISFDEGRDSESRDASDSDGGSAAAAAGGTVPQDGAISAEPRPAAGRKQS